jgi:endonuclease/exonuclease/phosphatase family metal-dependent hydrolase
MVTDLGNCVCSGLALAHGARERERGIQPEPAEGAKSMKCVTYNIQYGVGLDGEFQLERISDAIRGADVIALQEVTRNNPQNGYIDVVAGIRKLLPDYFSVYGAPYEVDMGSRLESGRAVDVRLQFGNMVLSKTPISASRNLLLPRRRTYGKLNLQRGALEALIETPFGPVRFYSVHLDHTSPDERIAQIDFLLARACAYQIEGGAVTGVSEMGFSEPPHPEEFVLMGDFNMESGSPEYLAMTGMPDEEHGIVPRAIRPVDAALIAATVPETATWIDPKRPGDTSRHKRIDYGFVHAALAGRVKRVWVDTEAEGSDHRPVWLEMD